MILQSLGEILLQDCEKCCKLYLEEFRGSISFIQLEEIIVKGLSDCIVFKEEERSEYYDYKTFFQEQLLKLGDVLEDKHITRLEKEKNYG